MESRERKVFYYKTALAVYPFKEWLDAVGDDTLLAQVDARIARMRGGNFGNSEPIGSGASENKIDWGPGYRLYYGVDGERIVLLCAGDKSTQAADIKRAKTYWKDYSKRRKEERKKQSKAVRSGTNGGLQERSHKSNKK